MQVVSAVDDLLACSTVAQLPDRVIALLQAEKFASCDLKKRRQPIECDASLTVDPIGAGQFLPRIAGPHQTNSGLVRSA